MNKPEICPHGYPDRYCGKCLEGYNVEKINQIRLTLKYGNIFKHDGINEKIVENTHCIGCGKDLECYITHGGMGEYGAYLICKDCREKKFYYIYEGY